MGLNSFIIELMRLICYTKFYITSFFGGLIKINKKFIVVIEVPGYTKLRRKTETLKKIFMPCNFSY